MTAAAGHRRPGANRIDREELDSMKEAIHTDRAPAAIGPYSQAVRAGGFLFIGKLKAIQILTDLY